MEGKALTGWFCFWLVACTGRAAVPPQGAPPAPPPEQPSEACRAARELRRDAHERLEARQWFAAARRLASANGLCAATQASTADALRAAAQLKSGAAETPKSLLDQARTAGLAGNAPLQVQLEDRAAFLIEQTTGSPIAPRLPTAYGDHANYVWSPGSDWLFERSEDAIALRLRDEWYPRFRSDQYGGERRGDKIQLSPDRRSWLDFDTLGERRGPERWVSLVDVSPGADFGKLRSRFRTVDYPDPAFSADNARLVLAESTSPGHSTLTVVTLATGVVERRIEPPAGSTGVSSLMLGDVGRSAVVRWSDASLSVVELATGETWHHAGSTALTEGAFSPDERFLLFGDHAFGDAHHLVSYDTVARRARPLAVGTCTLSGELVYDEQSKLAAIGSYDGELCLLELASGKLRKLRIETPLGVGLPQRFFYGTRGLFLANRDGGILLDVAAGKTVATFPDLMGLLQVNEQPAVISTRGTFAIIEPLLAVRQVEPQPRPAGLASTATVLGAEIGLGFDSGWLIVHAATAKQRPFAFPSEGDPLPNESPDSAYVTFSAGSAPEIYSAASGQRAARSPLAFGAAPTLLADDAHSKTTTTCPSEHLRDPSGAARLVRQSDGRHTLLNCATGEEGAPFPLPDYPLALFGNRVLVGKDGQLVVWDLQRRAAIGQVPQELNNQEVFALSSDDRYLFTGNTLWDVAGQQRLLKLEYWPESAAFSAQNVLLTRRGVTTDLWRAPRFAHVGAAYASRDAASSIVFALDASGGVSALETRGAREAWDTTFACSAGALGVPFRVCREALEQSGLLASLLQ